MNRSSWIVPPVLAVVAVLLVSAALWAHPLRQVVVVPSPVVRYYTPARVYYSAPVVTYYTPSTVYYASPLMTSVPFYSYYMSPGYFAPRTTYYYSSPLVTPPVVYPGTTYYTPLYYRY